MPKVELDSVDGLPEPVRPLFVPDKASGKFIYDPEAIPETEGLRNNSAKLVKERAELAAKLQEFGGLGKTAAELKAELEALEELRAGRGKAWEAERAQLVDRHKAELADRDGKYGKLSTDWAASQISSATQAAVNTISVEGAATQLAAMLRRGTTPDGRDFQQLDWRQDKHTGQWGLTVLDPAGNPRTKGSVGEPFTLADLVLELGKDPAAKYLIKATEGSGSDGRPGEGPGGGNNFSGVNKKSDLKTTKDKAAYINVRGLDAWNALPDGP